MDKPGPSNAGSVPNDSTALSEVICTSSNLCLYPNIVKEMTKLRRIVREVQSLLHKQLKEEFVVIDEIEKFSYCRCEGPCQNNILQMFNLLMFNVNTCEVYLIEMKLMRDRFMSEQQIPSRIFNYNWICYNLKMIKNRAFHVKHTVNDIKLVFAKLGVPVVYRKRVIKPSQPQIKKKKTN